jgi:osmotically-inducible protein OsmY
MQFRHTKDRHVCRTTRRTSRKSPGRSAYTIVPHSAIVVAALLAAIGYAGCVRQAEQPGTTKGKGDSGARGAGQIIRSPAKPAATAVTALEVKRALDADKSLRDKVAVGVSGHTVTLSGTVPGAAHRKRAEVIAKRVTPRYEIVNLVKVGPSRKITDKS